MHPQSTPQNSSGTPTMLSKNAPLAEMRFWQVPSINRLQTPKTLVLNRAFQIATNKNLSGWKLRCCLAAVCASGTECLMDQHLAWRRKCPNMMICAHRRLYKVQQATGDCAGSAGVEIKQRCPEITQRRTRTRGEHLVIKV